jgi:hypothetical protein
MREIEAVLLRVLRVAGLVERRRCSRSRPDVRVTVHVDAYAKKQALADGAIHRFVQPELVVLQVLAVARGARAAERVGVLRRPRQPVVALEKPPIVRKVDGELHAGQRLAFFRKLQAA